MYQATHIYPFLSPFYFNVLASRRADSRKMRSEDNAAELLFSPYFRIGHAWKWRRVEKIKIGHPPFRHDVLRARLLAAARNTH
jgi:hypothetical protein